MIQEMSSMHNQLHNQLFVKVLLLTVITHTVASLSIPYEEAISYQKYDLYQSESVDLYNTQPNVTNVETIEDSDSDYPYEQLLEIVRETKKLLRNNTAKKENLRLDPSVYQNYLNGDFSDSIYDFPPASQVPAYAGGAGLNRFKCRVEVIYTLPRKLRSIDGTEHYILNLGSELRQKVNTIRCRNPGKRCNDPSTWPENYAYYCNQSYGRIKQLISIPVEGELSLTKQSVQEFKIPDSCICNRERMSNY